MPARVTSVRSDKVDEDRPKPKLTTAEMEAVKETMKLRAKYKIEIIFSRHRSSRLEKESPLMLLIWESGLRFHGGGDQKMYWCGYSDCDMPISSDLFAYMHVICPHCNKELFLDPGAKQVHVDDMKRRGLNPGDVRRIPYVVGERLANLTPHKIAELLEKTWRRLDGDADIYLKYSPYEIRYDPKSDDNTKVIDKLDKVRVQRKPLIYTLKSIMKDLHAGADLRKRFLAMITS